MIDKNKAKVNNDLIGKVFSRFLVYTLIIFAIAVSLPVIVEYGDFIVFAENGPVEWMQLIFIFVSVALLLFDSFHNVCEFKQLFCAVAFLQLCAAAREMDLVFDNLIPVAGWKLPAVLCASVVIIIYWKSKDAFEEQVGYFIRTRSFTLLWCGFIIAVPYSQLVGHGKFLELLMGNDYMRDYKRVIEELGEFLGYLFIMIGSIEAVLQRKEE
jgi:hypothetical protein